MKLNRYFKWCYLKYWSGVPVQFSENKDFVLTKVITNISCEQNITLLSNSISGAVQ